MINTWQCLIKRPRITTHWSRSRYQTFLYCPSSSSSSSLPRPYGFRKNISDAGEMASAFPSYARPSQFITPRQIIEKYRHASSTFPQESLVVGGRVLAIREMSSKLAFLDLYHDGYRLQIITKDPSILESIQRGDIIEVVGILSQTRAGELSIRAERIKVLTPCIQNVPSLHAPNLTDDHKCRWRHLDFISRPINLKFFHLRTRIIRAVQKFLEEQDFMEVETPILSTKVGGALARPFITRLNYNDHVDVAKSKLESKSKSESKLYLRIAPELYLKRLIIGGMDRVFEIGKVFRNEGIDTTHNPEFTMLEMYQSFASARDMMNLTKELLVFVAKKVEQTAEFKEIIEFKEITDFNQDFQIIDIVPELESILKTKFALKDPINLQNQVNELLNLHQISHDVRRTSLSYRFDKLIAHFLEPLSKQQPTFLINHPLFMCPLAAHHPNNTLLADRFELFIQGHEIANGYSELRDPHEQWQRFREQARNQDDSEATIPDKDFVDALEAGMPPTAGCGIGIDRLIMLLMGQSHIRDVILFPFLKQLS